MMPGPVMGTKEIIRYVPIAVEALILLLLSLLLISANSFRIDGFRCILLRNRDAKWKSNVRSSFLSAKAIGFMRVLRVTAPGLLFPYLLCNAGAALGCDLPAGQPLWIRLTSPISTYSAQVNDLVHAVLTQDVACANNVVIPL